MRAGLLRHRVTVQSASASADAFGQLAPAWADVGTYWANVQPLSGREAERARQVRADATHVVDMRIPTAITVEHRLRFDGRTLNIVEVRNVDERDRQYRVTAAEALTGSKP